MAPTVACRVGPRPRRRVLSGFPPRFRGLCGVRVLGAPPARRAGNRAVPAPVCEPELLRVRHRHVAMSRGAAEGGVRGAVALALALCGASASPLQLRHGFGHEAQRRVPQRARLVLRALASAEGFARGG